MRDVKYIVLHCTATPQNTTVDSIKKYWKNTLKWNNVGYHYVIEANGNIVQLADESKVTNGVGGYNTYCIHISYMGGIDSKGKAVDNRTEKQKEVMFTKVKELLALYEGAELVGHCDFPNVKKACPSFDAKEWFDKENIIGDLDPKTEKRV